MTERVSRYSVPSPSKIEDFCHLSHRERQGGCVAKLQIARKETAETLYWLELLHECAYLPDKPYSSIYADCEEIHALLTAAIKSCEE